MTQCLKLTRLESTDYTGLGLRWLLAGILLLGVPGCKKSADPAASNPNGTQSSADGADVTVTLNELTQALRKYAIEKRGLPKNFADLVAAGYVKNPPPPPAGRRFEIDPKTSRVVLVSQ